MRRGVEPVEGVHIEENEALEGHLSQGFLAPGAARGWPPAFSATATRLSTSISPFSGY